MITISRAILTVGILLATSRAQSKPPSSKPAVPAPAPKEEISDDQATIILGILNMETSGDRDDALSALKYRRLLQIDNPENYRKLQQKGLGRSPLTGE